MMNNQQMRYVMHLIPLLLTAVIVCLMIVSCNLSTQHVPVQLKQQQMVLPAQLNVPCEIPVKRRNNTADALAEVLKELYDQYGQCSGRFIELLKYINEVNSGQR